MFSIPKLRKAMEDESLRSLACTKLNHTLERKYTSEDEYLDDVVRKKTVYVEGINRGNELQSPDIPGFFFEAKINHN